MGFKDRFDREIGSVRISLTDRCNLRCQYCMPEDGIKWLEKQQILTYEEIIALSSIFYKNGVSNFRLTGGEPLVRSDLTKFVELFKMKFPKANLAMTTNAIGLANVAKELKTAGLDRINISLDTLDHQKFQEITRRDAMSDVMKGITAAIDVELDLKINAVSIKGFNDDEKTLEEFIKFSDENDIEIRFIEIMPFTGNNWENGGLITSEEIRNKIKSFTNLIKLPVKNVSSTSRTWSVENSNAKIGFISSVSESFCENCNRVRITSDGKLRPCLHNAREYDLMGPLRDNASEEELKKIIQKGLNEKWKAHPDFLSIHYKNPVDDREMIRIGG